MLQPWAHLDLDVAFVLVALIEHGLTRSAPFQRLCELWPQRARRALPVARACKVGVAGGSGAAGQGLRSPHVHRCQLPCLCHTPVRSGLFTLLGDAPVQHEVRGCIRRERNVCGAVLPLGLEHPRQQLSLAAQLVHAPPAGAAVNCGAGAWIALPALDARAWHLGEERPCLNIACQAHAW